MQQPDDPIRNVVRPDGDLGLVEMAEGAADAAAAERLLARGAEERADWQRRADQFLAQSSSSRTWRQMSDLIDRAVATHRLAAMETERSRATCSIT